MRWTWRVRVTTAPVSANRFLIRWLISAQQHDLLFLGPTLLGDVAHDL